MLCLLRNPGFKLIAQNLSVTYQINQRHYQGRHINYYDVLGVKRHADVKEVKVAYFKMAKKFHPDHNKTLDAKQMFELIAEAYDVLSDEDKRKEYDETGCVSERHGGRSAQGPMRQSTDSTYTAEQMYSKIFSSREGFGERQQEVFQDYATNYSGTLDFFFAPFSVFNRAMKAIEPHFFMLQSPKKNFKQGSKGKRQWLIN